MHRFGVISNPYTRHCRKYPSTNDELRSLIGSKGLFRVTQSTSEIASVLKEFKTHKVTCVGIVGGDGSINLVLAELLKLYPEESLPNILVLGGGTANVLAINLGLPSKPLKVMSDFLNVNSQSPDALKITTIPSLRINNRIGFLFANGMAAKFLQLFYKKKGSVRDAGMLLAKTALHAATPKFISQNNKSKASHVMDPSPMSISGTHEITAWSKKHPDVTTIFVSTLKNMALSIPVFLKLDGNHAEFFATSAQNKQLTSHLARIVLRRPVSHANVVQCLVIKVKIDTVAGEPYTIDGELFDAPKEGVIIEVGPKFRFLSTTREARDPENKVHHRRNWLERFGAGRVRGRLGSLSRRVV